jgi:hypothetical protein
MYRHESSAVLSSSACGSPSHIKSNSDLACLDKLQVEVVLQLDRDLPRYKHDHKKVHLTYDVCILHQTVADN